jgi:spore coat polysaccharide biosynthesis protein SpsF
VNSASPEPASSEPASPAPQPTLGVFVQARMTSHRFPGKVLAPMAGEPLLLHLFRRLSTAVASEQIVLATSSHPSDDPLARYGEALGFAVFRGPLDDVFMRFRGCLDAYPCDWFARVCADSPLLDPALLQRLISVASGSDADLVSNIQTRTFPKGQSVEVVRASTFATVDPTRLMADDREHVTRFYYNHPDEFRIVNMTSADWKPGYDMPSTAVDTVEDLWRIEQRLLGSK